MAWNAETSVLAQWADAWVLFLAAPGLAPCALQHAASNCRGVTLATACLQVQVQARLAPLPAGLGQLASKAAASAERAQAAVLQARKSFGLEKRIPWAKVGRVPHGAACQIVPSFNLGGFCASAHIGCLPVRLCCPGLAALHIFGPCVGAVSAQLDVCAFGSPPFKLAPPHSLHVLFAAPGLRLRTCTCLPMRRLPWRWAGCAASPRSCCTARWRSSGAWQRCWPGARPTSPAWWGPPAFRLLILPLAAVVRRLPSFLQFSLPVLLPHGVSTPAALPAHMCRLCEHE